MRNQFRRQSIVSHEFNVNTQTMYTVRTHSPLAATRYSGFFFFFFIKIVSVDRPRPRSVTGETNTLCAPLAAPNKIMLHKLQSAGPRNSRSVINRYTGQYNVKRVETVCYSERIGPIAIMIARREEGGSVTRREGWTKCNQSR